MKKILRAFFLSSFFSLFTLSEVEGQSKFQITYTYDQFNVVSSVKNTASGYIAAGWAYGFTNLTPVGLMIQTDLQGTVQWAKTYSGGFFTPLDIMYMQKTAAGGYIMTGTRNNRALLMNINSSGANNWSRHIGNNNDWGNGLKETSAGDFIVAGSTTQKSLNANKDSTSIFIFKTNSTGTYQWGKTLTLQSPVFDSHDEALDVVEVSGGYVFTGYQSQNNGADTTINALLFKTDVGGNVLWMKSIGAVADNESGEKVIQLSNGDLAIAGYTDKTGLGDVCVVHTDNKGGVISSSSYNVGTFFAPEVNSFVNTSDGGYAVFGWCATSAAPLFNYKPFLLKLDAAFNIQFTEHYNSQIGGFFVRGEESSSGGYIIGSMVGSSAWDLNLIKTDSNGNSGCNENSYTATIKAYSPPTAAITPTVTSVGNSSNFTPTISNVTPTPTVVCSATAPVATAGANQSICSGGNTVIGGSPTASGGTTPY